MKVFSEKLGEDIKLLYQPVFIIKIIKELLKGKSLIRRLLNLTLEKFELNGCILDLGSKTAKSSYYRFLRKGNVNQTVFIDKYHKDPHVVKPDVEERFSFKNEEFGIVLAMFLFEEVFNYLSAFKEIYKVKRGKFFLAVPLIHESHPDPDDYFRFPHAALIKLV